MNQRAFPATRAWPAVALAGLLLAGCGRDQPWKVGRPAPAITVLGMDGSRVRLAQFRGQTVVLRFWAAGCSACAAGMADLDHYAQGWRGKGVVVLAVNRGNPPEQVQSFTRDLKLSFPVYLDPAQIAASKYGAVTMPTTYFIDARGTARRVLEGEISRTQFDQALAELI